jgi:thioesterase domain-containing protein
MAKHLLKMADHAPTAEQLRNLSSDAQIDSVFELAKTHGYLPNGFELEQWQSWVVVFSANAKAMISYRPQAYSGQIHFFRAAEAWNLQQRLHPEYFWIEKALQGISIDTISGNHLTMNLQPQVAEIAEKIAQYCQS